MFVRVLAVAAILVTVGEARAAETTLRYGPPSAWVKPAALPPVPVVEPGAGYAMLLYDEQTRYAPQGSETYIQIASKVLSEEGLQDLGWVSREWDPETESLTIHKVHVLRDGQVIDALKSDKFEVLRRETNLESSMLDGRLTATVQIRGLRVGDVIDTALTRRFRDPLGVDRYEDATAIRHEGPAGRYRVRALWTKAMPTRWRATSGFTTPVVTETAEGSELVSDMLLAKAPKLPAGAPMRYADQGTIEFSQFRDWAEISTLMAGHYARAATLEAASPLKAEVARIRAASADPAVQAALALKLVESQVRYVYVGMGAGALVPAAADETWRRRFGDCKAKTALLLALLTELGLPAEATLVDSSGGGNGLDTHLPRLALFDHVILRLALGGRVYWLDGTRAGDEHLANLEPPPYDWGLPLRATGGALERIAPSAPARPYGETLMRVDASAGIDAPADVTIDTYVRGDSAVALSREIASAPRDELERGYRSGWAKRITWVDFDRADWAFDAERAELRITVTGKGKIDWRQDLDLPRRWQIDGSFLSLPSYERDIAQDQEAPYVVTFPSYERWVTSVILPATGPQVRVLGRTVDETLGGYVIRRRAGMQNNRVVMFSSSRTLGPEVTAAEARAATARTRRADREFGITALQVMPEGSKTPEDTPIMQAWNALSENRLDAAERQFGRLKDDKDQARFAYGGLVETALTRRDYARALKLCDEAERKLADADAEGWARMRARIFRIAGTPDKAEAVVTAALVAKPDSLPLLRDLAVTHRMQNQLDKARTLLDRALALAPRDEATLSSRAALSMQMKAWDDAIARYEAALVIDPDDISLVLGQAQAYAGAERYDLALRRVTEARRIDPFSAASYSVSSDINSQRKDYAAALADADAVVALYPDSPGLLNNRCWTRATFGRDLDKALADCDGALKPNPKVAGYLDSRALVHARADRLDAALRDYDAALALEPRQVSSLFGRGLVRLRKGDTAGGRADLAAARAIDPDVETRFARYGLKPEPGA